MLTLAVHLAAAVALLLWSIRLIRTGIERAFLPELRRSLKTFGRNPLSAAAAGGGAAMVMQSSTAVILIGAGFAAAGHLSASGALAIAFGADVGSALLARVLFLPVADVVPFVMLAGVVLFLKARSRRTKQVGRILTGLSLTLLSLGMIRAAAEPIGASDIVQSIVGYLATDRTSAFVIGALLAWAMHSSLAAVLTFASFASVGLLGAPVALALVLGANVGGAAVPAVLLWRAPAAARNMAVGNLIAKLAVTLPILAALLLVDPATSILGRTAADQAIAAHIAVNLAVLVIALPLTRFIAWSADRLAPPLAADLPIASALDPAVLERPRLALSCGQRELLRMGETVQLMLTQVIPLFREWNADAAALIERHETEVDRMHYDTKLYVARLQQNELTEDQSLDAVQIVSTANNLEDAADRIAVDLVGLARKLRDGGLSFSEQGMSDVESFHDRIVTNAQLALSVLTTGDAEAARQLVSEKDDIRAEERRLQERHLARLGGGGRLSVETTNIHQETLRVLKQVNSAITYVAYPIAEQAGDLLDSRLARPATADGTA
ncbi:Na/Pi cotransporter family protein [Silicimonas algicola]|uniref:Phosphate:Na+ symporter n=1 Tax=Silicimonas algicola TaxID=1826607 RepID=A0A316GD10_9RHOB|nr:Na/Pi cotransporter family protein [Silicimonas algicola]AZQ66490.1 Na/Pi cotransporter family protein [Silicimonas algicola]PWK58828.1 phosphate:Na+ symporter [Silicimonas algicola]